MDVPHISKALGRAKCLVSDFHHSSKSSSILFVKPSDAKNVKKAVLDTV